ncbi:MAG: exonuclease [Bacteroidetes bacterium]|nr:exonuclease [Bacteroidota bacterium]
MNFTAIDFETAQGAGHSICQIGLVHVENGKIVSTMNQLIQPPANYYSYYNIKVHGITPEMTRCSPTFDDVWGQLKPYIEGQRVVAHNASFDMSCLRHTLAYYDLALPHFEQQCTYRIFKKKLSALCDLYRIPLNHHDALSDALACAKLYLIYLEQNKTFY